jgi:WD40 repeat protein
MRASGIAIGRLERAVPTLLAAGLALLSAATARTVLARGRFLPPAMVRVTRLERPAALALAVSPDSRLLAVAQGDGVVALWEIATRKRLRELKGHQAAASGVTFCAGTGELPPNVPRSKSVPSSLRSSGIAPSPTPSTYGQLVSVSSDRTVRAWDPDSGAERWAAIVLPEKAGKRMAAACSPDGKWVAVSPGTDGKVAILESGSGAVASSLTVPCLGMKLRWDYDTSAGRVVYRRSCGFSGQPFDLAFFPDGALAGARRHEIVLWTVAPPRFVDKVVFSYRRQMSFAISQRGRRLALARRDRDMWPRIAIYDVAGPVGEEAEPEERGELELADTDDVLSLSLSSDERYLAAGTDAGAFVWDLRRPGDLLGNMPIAVYRKGLRSLAVITPDQRTIITADRADEVEFKAASFDAGGSR